MIDPNREMNYQTLSVGQYWNFIQSHVALFLRGVTGKMIITVLDQTLASATNFLTGVIIGRACTKEEFGLYTLGFSIVILAIAIQNSLISMPYTVYSSRLRRDSSFDGYNGGILIQQLVLSVLIVACLISIGIILSLSKIEARGLNSVIWALAATISMILFRQFVRRMFFARLQMKTALLLDLCVGVLQIAGLLFLAHLHILSASTAYLMTGIACASVGIIWFVSSRKMFTFLLAQMVSSFRLHWSFGKWLLASSLAMMTATQSYLWLLSYFHGTGSTGTFGACIGVVYLINPMIIGTGNFIDPKAAHAYAQGGINEMHRILIKATVLFGIAVAVSSLILILFGGWGVAVLYGDKYTGNGLIVAVLALSNLSFALSIPANSALMAIEHTHIFLKSSLISLFITIFIGSWLVAYYGLIGAAVGLFLTRSSSSIFRWVALTRASRVRFNI